ncbi:MAG: UDP-N-acetylglucosamine 2-epimerase (non-hydrolyzing), partial [Terrimicrobiaceae bacterium]|nr:UDP-N-acetylglucosamine 2-epimerase (non-hydrolyzing) [Terrimicrobiaceae bacterium]
LGPVLEFFGIEPEADLAVMRREQTLVMLSARLLAALDRALDRLRPQLLIVQGDTTTVAMASYLGFCRRIPVAHVEAGLRTRDRWNPFPEEINRRIAGLTSSLHFCPMPRAREALLAEGIPGESIHVVGNTVIDALLAARGRLGQAPPALEGVDFQRPTIVLTMHRRESFGEPMAAVCRAVAAHLDTHPEMQVLFPLHKSPEVRRMVKPLLASVPRALLVEPLDYPSFVYAMMKCRFILTDSGGVQEEAPALGKPVVVLRKVTERPEAIEAGAAVLAGTDERAIVRLCRELAVDSPLYRRMARRREVYGDGRSSARIVRKVRAFLGRA